MCRKYRVDLTYPKGTTQVVDEVASSARSAADQAILDNPAAVTATTEATETEQPVSSNRTVAEEDAVDDLYQSNRRLNALFASLADRAW